MINTLLMSSFAVLPLSAAKIPVYVGSGSQEGISSVLLDSETGQLSGLKTAVTTSSPGSLTLSKDKKFIYSTGSNKGEKTGFVASFARQADGSLKLVNQQSSMGAGPCHVSLDSGSQFLFVANYSGGVVASYKVDDAGEISAAVSHHQHEGSSANPKRQSKAYAHSIYSSPDNQFVYAADLGMDKVMIYKLDSESGKLTLSGEAKVPAGSGARHMVFSKNGETLFVLNELTLTISKFSRDTKSGALKLESTQPVMKEMSENMSGSEIQLSADGEFIYAACRDLNNKQRDIISVLNAADLNIIQEQPAGAWIPRHFGISPSGKWMLIAGMRDNKVVVHARDPLTGKLTKTSNSVELESPMWILFP